MRVLLTSAGLETEEIKECFVDMAGKDMSLVKALYLLERINATGLRSCRKIIDQFQYVCYS